MSWSSRMLVLSILFGSILLSTSCITKESTTITREIQSITPESGSSLAPINVTPQQSTNTATQLPSPSSTSTSAPTSTSTLMPTKEPSATFTSAPEVTSTEAAAPLVPGIYSSGGCLDYTLVKKTNYGWPWASFSWCVEYVEIHKDGSMIFVMSWKLVDFSEGLTSITKRSDINNSNMYLIDNLGNRYDAVIVSGDAADDIIMEKDVTYYGTYTFRPPKPNANRFTFHDDDNEKEISDILLLKPSVYINDINLKWSSLAITYYTDKWTAGETDQGGFKLTHTKYTNCQVMEWQPGEAQGKYRGSIDISNLTYDMFSTQELDWSLREYIFIGGLGNVKDSEKPFFHVTVPYNNSIACLDDVSSILASLKSPSP